MTEKPCPVCDRPATEEFRPFCSKRCANKDLGNWLSDRYAIPAAPDLDEDDSLPDSEPDTPAFKH